MAAIAGQEPHSCGRRSLRVQYIFFLGSHHFGSYMVLESHDDHRVSTKVITFLLQAAIMRVGDLGRVVAGAGFTHVNSLHFVCIFPTL